MGTRNLIEGLRAAEQRPAVLVSSLRHRLLRPSWHRADRRGGAARRRFPGRDLRRRGSRRPSAPRSWNAGRRVRTGVVLDRNGGALEKMLPPFQMGVGGPVAGGRQFMPWIHTEDLVGIMKTALEDESWSGAGQRDRPHPGHQPRLLEGARPCDPQTFALARSGPCPAAALRRDGGDRDERRPGGSRKAADAGLRVPSLRARAGPAPPLSDDKRPLGALCVRGSDCSVACCPSR